MKRFIQRITAIALVAFMLFGAGITGSSPLDVTVYAASTGKLPGPSRLTFYTGSNSVTVNWPKVYGADAYKVGRYDYSSKKYVYTKLTAKTSFRITGLKPSTSYKFVVLSYDKINGKYVKQSFSKIFSCKTTTTPTSIKLSAKSKTVNEDKKITVTATVTPNTFKDVVWKISNTSVAKITGKGPLCTITGLKAGTATLTATAGKKTVSCKITVKPSNNVDTTDRAEEILPDSTYYFIDDSEHVEPYLDAAEKRKQEILNSKTEIVKSDKFIRGETYTGTAYYISNNGDDDNNGLSPETPWKTLNPLNWGYWDGTLKEGDAIFFERGGVYRLDKEIGFIWLKSNVTYSAYGEGEKPVITLAAENSAREECWELYYDKDGKKIWKYYKDILQTAGIVFDDETYAPRVWEWPTTKGWEATETAYYRPDHGITKPGDPTARTGPKGTGIYPTVEDNLKENLTFICRTDISDITYPIDWGEADTSPDAKPWTLYLRCDEGNPGTLYDDIEVVAQELGGGYHLLFAWETSGFVLDNISLKYYCSNAIQADYMKSKDIVVQNCTIEWGGNRLFKAISETVQNDYSIIGDSIYGPAINAVIRNNYMRYCGNACTFESYPEYYRQDANLGSYTCTGNVIENCGQGIRTYLINSKARLDTLTISDNYILNTGEYFNNACFETPCAIDLGGNYQFADKIIVSDNVVVGSTLALIRLPDPQKAKVDFSGNVFIQERGKPLAVLLKWLGTNRVEFIPFSE